MTRLPPSARDDLERLERMTSWLDDRFVIPGTGIRFGLDPVLGLIPGIGDTVSTAFTALLIGHAQRHGLPGSAKAKMLWNLALDWVVGSIPLVGDLFDIGFRANRRNFDIIKRHLEKRAAEEARAEGPEADPEPRSRARSQTGAGH